ncbi:bifunctional glycosyltransferase/CDP-glycerol:glycerophosphate glycerophosphotransferase [Nocardioides conyzicola]|uniref:CDP-glycerol glycerophosphotransferase family protein n=1 Tax=Nocardioides conyzicola TaxID=1651781 RepID=A0ABP8X5T1_9ACTN
MSPRTDAPSFSIVSAVYDVAPYLDEFIGSIEAQTLAPERFEVIVVDDGSTDSSLARLRRWQAESAIRVQVLTQTNSGQGSARNLGLGHASGTWVTFTDPDDWVAEDYLERVSDFVDSSPDIDLMVTQFSIVHDATGEVRRHPLRSMFRDGDVPRRLNDGIDFFTGSAPAAFFRRDRLIDEDLRFDDRVRPNFEDGHFTARYLLGVPDPVVGFIGRARYHYRRRADGTSTLQRSLSDAGRYTSVLRYGYLDVLQRAVAQHGAVPAWLQALVIYDLSWFFSTDERYGAATAGRGAVADEFHSLLAEIVGHLEPSVVEGFRARPLKREWRYLLLHGYASDAWQEGQATVTGYDRRRELVRLSYYFTGAAPHERLQVKGVTVTPYAAKIRDVVSHGRVLLHERILWTSARASIRLQLDHRDVVLHPSEPDPVVRTLFPGKIQQADDRSRGIERPPGLTPEQHQLLDQASSRKTRRRFEGAWVLMDRIHDADDSGEHLFRHLRRERPDINAWFVLEKDTPDWRRLRKDGHGRRLVAFGSDQWKLLMLNCRHLVSSHADDAIVDPGELDFVDKPWRFTFLQHGVIKDDLSTWLNRKPIDLIVTSTVPELESIVADHTAYKATQVETVLTGLPRFDLLHRVGAEIGPERRDLLLVAPTWRNWLALPLINGTQRRGVPGPEFFESEFFQRWTAVLGDPRVAESCARHGLTIGFLPHPNLSEVLEGVDLPDHVRQLSFVGTDVRELFARAALLVTDYSSMAFNSAYIDRPVVYYQFDRERVLGGDHVGRTGYFDYERDGFGPVRATHDEVVAAILAALEHGPVPAAPYDARIAATFPVRDGRCCERVTEAILALDRKVPRAAAGRPLDRIGTAGG